MILVSSRSVSFPDYIPAGGGRKTGNGTGGLGLVT